MKAHPPVIDAQPFQDLLALDALTLATQGDNGPHAAPVFFAADEALRLYFFSDPYSLHSRHLAQDPRAAVAFYPPAQVWNDIHGLQMQGRVHQVEAGPQWEQGWSCYRAKFPFVDALEAVIAQNALYVFVPHWIRLVDNRRGFGFKQEWTLP
jgi:uncharacterized protein YhbP (UPF0306 family)